MAAVSRGTSHVKTEQHCKYTTVEDTKTIYCAKLQSLIQSQIWLKHSWSAQKQRTAPYSCHCEALRAHLKMRHSTSVCIIIKAVFTSVSENPPHSPRLFCMTPLSCSICGTGMVRTTAWNEALVPLVSVTVRLPASAPGSTLMIWWLYSTLAPGNRKCLVQ